MKDDTPTESEQVTGTTYIRDFGAQTTTIGEVPSTLHTLESNCDGNQTTKRDSFVTSYREKRKLSLEIEDTPSIYESRDGLSVSLPPNEWWKIIREVKNQI